MANTSASGGYLVPADAPPPAEGDQLNAIVQQFVVGITGLDGSLVRPRWQPEPGNIPDSGQAWAAVGIGSRPGDSFPYVAHDSSGTDSVYLNETLEALASFYDTGSTGMADYYAARFRSGAYVAQNREALFAQGFMLLEVGVPQPLPTLLNERWLYRVDVPFRLRRVIAETYPVENVESGVIAIIEQDPDGHNVTVTVNVTNPPD